MKKLLAIFLAIVMMATLTVAAFAAAIPSVTSDAIYDAESDDDVEHSVSAGVAIAMVVTGILALALVIWFGSRDCYDNRRKTAAKIILSALAVGVLAIAYIGTSRASTLMPEGGQIDLLMALKSTPWWTGLLVAIDMLCMGIASYREHDCIGLISYELLLIVEAVAAVVMVCP